jgi:hypothetical protein
VKGSGGESGASLRIGREANASIGGRGEILSLTILRWPNRRSQTTKKIL